MSSEVGLMAETIHLKLVRSPIGTKQCVRQTLKGLGLNKVGSSSTLEKTPPVLGMFRRVMHLVEEIKQ
jgi:large subunit ribosomal protein L30